MAVIVDYFKNDRIYNNDLIELVPTNLDTYSMDNNLRRTVQKFDELTFGMRKELSDVAYFIKCDKDTLVYSLDDGRINIGYYYNIYKDFNIEVFIGEEHAIGNIPFVVKHIFNKNNHIIKIIRDVNYGYIPEIDLTNMKESYTKEYVSDENINVVIDELNLVNKSLERYYAKKLEKKETIRR